MVLLFSGSIDDQGPYEIIINSNDMEYMFLPTARLTGSFKVTKGEGEAIGEGDNVSIINNLPSSLWKQVECYVGNVQIEDTSSSTYHYKALIQTLLSYDNQCKESTLESSLYVEDSILKEAVDEYNCKDAAKNKALFERKKLIKLSKKCDFSTPLHVDFFQCGRYIPPNTEIKLKFIRNDDDLLLMGEAGYKIKLLDLNLFVRKIFINEKIRTNQTHLYKTLNKNMIFPYPTTKIRAFTLTSNITSKALTICEGILPQQVIIGFVKNSAYSGGVQENPYNFKHFGLKRMRFKKNGESFPAEAFEPDWTNKNYTKEYRWVMDNTGILHNNVSNGLTMDQWASHKNLWAYDLSADQSNGEVCQDKKIGHLELDLMWNTALSHAVTLLCMFIYECNSGILLNHKYGVAKLEDHRLLT